MTLDKAKQIVAELYSFIGVKTFNDLKIIGGHTYKNAYRQVLALYNSRDKWSEIEKGVTS